MNPLILLLVGFFVLIAFRVNIGFSLILSSVFLILWEDLPLTSVVNQMYANTESFTLLAIPFFMFLGRILNAGSITDRLLAVADASVGHVRGGLGHVNVFVSMIFASLSGSAAADTASVGSILIPAMKKAGYNPALCCRVDGSVFDIGCHHTAIDYPDYLWCFRQCLNRCAVSRRGRSWLDDRFIYDGVRLFHGGPRRVSGQSFPWMLCADSGDLARLRGDDDPGFCIGRRYCRHFHSDRGRHQCGYLGPDAYFYALPRCPDTPVAGSFDQGRGGFFGTAIHGSGCRHIWLVDRLFGSRRHRCGIYYRPNQRSGRHHDAVGWILVADRNGVKPHIGSVDFPTHHSSAGRYCGYESGAYGGFNHNRPIGWVDHAAIWHLLADCRTNR